MGWADGHIARLAQGETVQFRPRGNSMVGKIASGQLCTVEPLGRARARGRRDRPLPRQRASTCHLVKAIQASASRSATTAAASTAGSPAGQIFGRLIALAR